MPGSSLHPLCQTRDDAEGPWGPLGTPRDWADVARLGTARALTKRHRPGLGGAATAPASARICPRAGGSGSGLWFGGWVQPLAVAETPEEHRGVPGVASGSRVLQSCGFKVPRGSVCPSRSQSSAGSAWSWVVAGSVPGCSRGAAAPAGAVLSTGGSSAPRRARGAVPGPALARGCTRRAGWRCRVGGTHGALGRGVRWATLEAQPPSRPLGQAR